MSTPETARNRNNWTNVFQRNAKKYALKFMKNFAEEMWRYCGMRMVSLTGWKDEDGAVQACWYVPESSLSNS